MSKFNRKTALDIKKKKLSHFSGFSLMTGWIAIIGQPEPENTTKLQNMKVLYIDGFGSIPRAIPALFLSLSITCANAAPGDLDPSFGEGGITLTEFGGGEDVATSMALQPDGKLLVAGSSGYAGGRGKETNFAVVRYTVDDTLDPSFGSAGKIVTPVGIDSSQAKAVGVQAGGRIVLAGDAFQFSGESANAAFALAGFHPDGTLDDAFGEDGMVMTDVGPQGSVSAMILTAEGDILVAGTAGNPMTMDTSLVVVRYLGNGVLDPAFGVGGIVRIARPGGIVGNAMAVPGDGKILVAGTANGQITVVRLRANGSPDPDFDADGVATIPVGTTSSATVVAVQFGDGSTLNPDKIVLAGSSTTNFRTSFAVARLHLDGTPDASFDGDGRVATSVGDDLEGAHSILIQNSGPTASRIIVAGFSSAAIATGFRRNFTVVKYLPDGSLDTAFDGDGIAKTPIGAKGDSTARAMVMQNGKLLVAGHTQSGPGPRNNDFAMVRYNLDAGTLDLSYDSDGIKLSDVTDSGAGAYDVVIQPDGKIIVAGFVHDSNRDERVGALARYHPDGMLDPSFGAAGKVLIDAGTDNSSARVLALQPDGKIVVVGKVRIGGETNSMLARFLSNGLPDPTFGENGLVTPLIGANDDTVHKGLTLQTDGKIIVAGASFNGVNGDFSIARYNADGSPDTSFNGSGTVSTDIGGGNESAVEVKIQADGKIIAAGTTGLATNRFALVRYLANGTLDPSFGTSGKVTTAFGTGEHARAMVIQGDGRIVVAGFGGGDIAVARYLANGALDTSFDGDGRVTTSLGIATTGVTFGMALQSDGKILVAGLASVPAEYPRPALVRYLTNGSLDPSYGTAGKVVVDPVGNFSIAYGVAVDEAGRAVIAFNTTRFGVARFLGDPITTILSIIRPPNGEALIQGSGTPNGSHTLHASPTMHTNSFLPIFTVHPDASGSWQFMDVEASTFDQRFYRLGTP